MSAGVSDQRMKGQGNQVTNGPKEHVNDHEDFDSWRSTQHHQGYSTPISTTLAGSDPYSMSNYYGTSFPYQAFGVGDGTWSNGDPMTFLGGYGGQMGHDSYMDGMFGGGGGSFGAAAFGPTAAGFNYFHPAGAGGGGGGGGAGGGAGAGDYSTWGNSAAAMSRKPHYEDYYRIGGGGGGNEGPYDGVKGVEQGMHALGIDGNTGHKELKDGKELKESSAPKKMTWASIASQPAKPTPAPGPVPLKKKGPGMPPPPMVPGKHNMDIGTWDGKKTAVGAPPPSARPPSWGQQQPQGPPQGPPQGGNVGRRGPQPQFAPAPLMSAHLSQPPPSQQPQPTLPPAPPPPPPHHPVLDELCVKNDYNPHDYDLSAKGARFFVIKSYSEDDIHRSIKYEIWCSTEHGNKRLDQAWREREGKGPVYLFFSVNGSGHFCGMAQMSSPIDYHASSSVWSQDKWKGQFRVRWVYVKDVPNVQLRHIRLENNENKPVTNSRDTQEVPFEKGRQVLRILHGYRHSTSIFDDFIHYETRQEEEDSRKLPEPPLPPGPAVGGGGNEHRGPQGHRQPPQGHQSHKDRGDGGRGRGRGGGGGGPRPN